MYVLFYLINFIQKNDGLSLSIFLFSTVPTSEEKHNLTLSMCGLSCGVICMGLRKLWSGVMEWSLGVEIWSGVWRGFWSGMVSDF